MGVKKSIDLQSGEGCTDSVKLHHATDWRFSAPHFQTHQVIGAPCLCSHSITDTGKPQEPHQITIKL